MRRPDRSGRPLGARSWPGNQHHRGAASVARKKKVRVAFKKNRQKRTRANDLTGRYRGDELTGADPVKGERVRPKGELSRRRTIIEEVPDEGEGAGAGSAAEPAATAAEGLRSCL